MAEVCALLSAILDQSILHEFEKTNRKRRLCRHRMRSDQRANQPKDLKTRTTNVDRKCMSRKCGTKKVERGQSGTKCAGPNWG